MFPGDSVAPRVLIVDDDPATADTFSRTLRLEGYEVWAGLSAEEGLSLAQTHQPNVIVLDLRMPLEDEMRDEIKALGAELRFKPIWIEELVTLARELLRVPVKP